MCAETYAKVALCNLSVHTCASLILRPPTRRILLSYWKTLKLVLYGQFLQIEVLNESNLASLCTKHVFKEKEKKTSNRKVRIYESRKMCGCKVNPVLYRRKRTYRSQSKHPTFMLPITPRLLTSGHECMCFHHLWVCAYTCALQVLSVSYGHSLQTESVSRYRTPELFWPPLPMHTILVSGLHVEVCKPRSPGHIPPALWHSAPGFK